MGRIADYRASAARLRFGWRFRWPQEVRVSDVHGSHHTVARAVRLAGLGVLVAALVTAGAALGTTPVAHAAGTVSTAVHGCVNAKTRALTVPRAGGSCPTGTSSLQWNVRGPQGPRGATGASGLATVLASPNYDWSAPTAMASDGSHLWIVNQTNDSVTEISVSGSFVRNLHGAPYNFGGPDAVLFDGSHLWVANYTANTLTEIDPGDGSFIRTVTDASVNQPDALAFDGTHIWVADYGD